MLGRESTRWPSSPQVQVFDGPLATFRSAILSPILARQRRGVPGIYKLAVCDSVGEVRENVTLREATRFYLGDDPTDPRLVPKYRAGIIRTQEARWHLATVLKVAKVGDAEFYDDVDIRQTNLVHALCMEPQGPTGPCYEDGEILPDYEGTLPEEGEIPPEPPVMPEGVLFPCEVEILVWSRVEGFFRPELMKAARPPSTSSPRDSDRLFQEKRHLTNALVARGAEDWERSKRRAQTGREVRLG